MFAAARLRTRRQGCDLPCALLLVVLLVGPDERSMELRPADLVWRELLGQRRVARPGPDHELVERELGEYAVHDPRLGVTVDVVAQPRVRGLAWLRAERYAGLDLVDRGHAVDRNHRMLFRSRIDRDVKR